MTEKSFHNGLLSSLAFVAIAALGIVTVSCGSTNDQGPKAAAMSDPTAPGATGATATPNSAETLAASYRLGPGDKLRVIVYQEQDLSGEFEVDSTGQVALPLIEPIAAQGMTIRQFQEAAVKGFSAGYIVNPRVSVEILNYRPFYITGEVTRPGEYPYVAGMNILKAVAMAGGYTYRANTKRVLLTRGKDDKEGKEVEPTADMTILPGDYIRVPERFF